ncbi:hypothetical protein MRX96_021753 [Rhipicephalus microplus]
MASPNQSDGASELGSHFASAAMTSPNAASSALTTPSAPSAVRSPTAPAPSVPAPAPAAPAPRAANANSGGASDGDDGVEKAKQDAADQAVFPTLLRIIRKKLGKRFKETRDLVMFIVVVMFALVYLIISSKLILDRIELPAQYIDQHLTKETLCTDPYSSICNENYFHSGENRFFSLWPYRYANLQFIYEVFKNIIKRDFKNFEAPVKPVEETAIYKALYFFKNCTNSHLKRAMARVGLPSIPYSAEDNKTYEDVAIVLGNVMRSLDLEIFFVVDFVPHTSSKADAPFGKKVLIRKLPHLYATKERRRDNTATEKSEYAYSLMKTPQLMPPHERLYNYITNSFYNFTRMLSLLRVKWTEEEVKKSPTLAELQDATTVKGHGGRVIHEALVVFRGSLQAFRQGERGRQPKIGLSSITSLPGTSSIGDSGGTAKFACAG